MKKTLFIAGCWLLICLWSSLALAVVTPSPSRLTIPRGTQTVRVVQYRFNTQAATPRFASDEVLFFGGDILLGRFSRRLSVTLRPTAGLFTGTVSEQIVIPETVIRRAEELGISRLRFQRTFVEQDITDGVAEIATVDIAVTTAGGGPLSITSLRLYFDNNLGNITVQRNRKKLSVRADLDYTGTGFLRAFWQVDGRILAYVNRYLSSGRRITLETPAVPGLPTFREGSHTVRLIIQQPDQEIPFPKALYYVTSDQSPALVAINLNTPDPQAREQYAPFRVAWAPAVGAATYLVEFFLKDEDRPVFSAYTAASQEYVLPEPALRHYFMPGRSYDWQVKGFDQDNNLVGESDRREFRLE